MSKSTYQILAVIYDLIGEHETQSFVDAGKNRGVSPNIRRALLALAEEARFAESAVSARPMQRRKKNSGEHRHRNELPNLSPDLPVERYRENLLDFLTNTRHFRVRSQLVDFVHHLGYPMDFDAKDSRQRVAKKLVSFALKEPELRQAISDTVTRGESSQTQGWLKLIRGED